MIYRVFGFLVCLLLMGFNHQYIFQKISMEMETRSAADGKATRMKASLYYTSEGKMLTYFSEPYELVIVNNKKGELIVYNPAENTVLQQQNYMLGTETNQLYFFLENKRNDLGLLAMDYTIRNTRMEDGLKITEWSPPINLVKEISKVELVHEKGNPIFMAYHAANGAVLKKMFFYTYTKVSDYISLPAVVTQIDFKSPKDSIVTKTTYSQFKLNQQVADEQLNFVVPSNAKVLTPAK
jgi:outer membrane lipoprotein-sorting protein